uniref:MADS-box protein 04g005320 n=1 Tax=Erigeron canadensis TaxID=72917 RepID=UPI001CB980AE|nr:MADS-box protein 04g005320 [Erigeron canadensis]
MGRGRVELKRIENKINRQVTFAKRRNGLLKKAYELSVLCDAEIALIIFSSCGKLHEFCSGPSMSKTLERYHRCNYGTMEANHEDEDSQDNYQEYLKLKAKVDILQQSQRNYLGEELERLGSKELDRLERQLDSSLRQVRSTKTRRMLSQLSELQQKEQSLLEVNKSLKHKLEESSSAAYQVSWKANERNFENGQIMPPRREGYFQSFDCNDNIQIGYNNEAPNDDPSILQNANGIIPGWML